MEGFLVCICPKCQGIRFEIVNTDYRCVSCRTIVYPEGEELKTRFLTENQKEE